jgi:hypothetical protein
LAKVFSFAIRFPCLSGYASTFFVRLALRAFEYQNEFGLLMM